MIIVIASCWLDRTVCGSFKLCMWNLTHIAIIKCNFQLVAEAKTEMFCAELQMLFLYASRCYVTLAQSTAALSAVCRCCRMLSVSLVRGRS